MSTELLILLLVAVVLVISGASWARKRKGGE